MIRRTQTRLPRLLSYFQTPYPSSSKSVLQHIHSHTSPRSINCITCISTRLYATFDYSKAPTKLFMASFLTHRYRQINNWIFEGDTTKIGKDASLPPSKEGSKVDFVHFLRWTLDFEENKINAIIEVYDRLIEVLYEMNQGFEFLDQIWQAIFFSPITCSNSRLKLQEMIVERREALIKTLIFKGRYDIYDRLIKPRLSPDVDPISKFDNIIQIIQPQRIYDEKMNGEKIVCNWKRIEAYVAHQDNDIHLKREVIKWFIKIVLNPTNGMTFKKEYYQQRMLHTERFIVWTYLVEKTEWFVNARTGTPYDEILPLIGVFYTNTKDERYVKKITIEKFLQDIVRIVSTQHRSDVSYHFLSIIMRTITDKYPQLTYKYFTFKESEVRLMSLPKEYVLFVDDLTCAIRACFEFDIERIHQIYSRHEDLHDGDEGQQETVLLELCRKLKDWDTLQKRFESMYGRGDLPLTVHYGIVMQSLYALNADDEMERLFDQLDWRELKLSAPVMSALMKSKIRIHNQEKVVELFEDYIMKVKIGKADPEGVQSLFPLVLELAIFEKNVDLILEYIEKYIEREKYENFIIIDGKTLNKVLHLFLDSYSLKNIEKLKILVKNSNKESTEYFSGLISAYSNLDLFEIADAISYDAHGKSLIPFSEKEIWSQQLKNYLRWLKRCPDLTTEIYIRRKLTFIARNTLNTNDRIFDSKPGMSILNDLMSYFNYIKELKIPGKLFRKAKNADLKSEIFFTQHLKTLIQYSKESKVIPVFQRMNERKIMMTARTYEIVVQAILKLDQKSDKTFENSTSLIHQIQGYYGLSDERNKIDELNLSDDVIYLTRMIINYLSVVGPKKGAEVFLDFVRKIYEKLGNNISFKLHSLFFEGLRLVSGVGEEAVSKELEKTRSLINKYVEECTIIENSPIPHDLSDSCSKLLIEKFELLKSREEFDKIENLNILDSMLIGVKFTDEQYTMLLKYFLDFSNFKYLHQVLEIIEKYLISGNMDRIDFYQDKRLCFKICLKYIADSYYGEEEDQAIMDTYKVLIDYYDINSMDDVRKNVEDLKSREFLRSPTGRIFNISSDPYPSRTMNQHKFLEYFNPERIPNQFSSISPELFNVLLKKISEYREQNELDFGKLMDMYPYTMDFILNKNSQNLTILLQRFRDIVYEYFPHYNSRKWAASRYLKRTLLNCNYRLFIKNDTEECVQIFPEEEFESDDEIRQEL